jgi:hypothetical protein
LSDLQGSKLNEFTYLHFSVDSITATKSPLRPIKPSRNVIPGIGATLSIGAISRHMPCIAADSTDDIGSEVALFWAVVFAMSNLSTWRG